MNTIAKTFVALALAGSLPAFAHPGHPALNAIHSHGLGMGLVALAAALLVYLVVRTIGRRS